MWISQMFFASERAWSASDAQFVKTWIGYSGEAKDHIKMLLSKKSLKKRYKTNIHKKLVKMYLSEKLIATVQGMTRN